jgi:hypothetical protein
MKHRRLPRTKAVRATTETTHHPGLTCSVLIYLAYSGLHKALHLRAWISRQCTNAHEIRRQLGMS